MHVLQVALRDPLLAWCGLLRRVGSVMASSTLVNRVPAKASLGGSVRRHALTAILLGVAGLAVGVPDSQANTGDPVIAGRTTYAGTATRVVSSSGDGLEVSTSEPNGLYSGISAYDGGSGPGVKAGGASGYGVEGYTQLGAAGVYGLNSGEGSGVEGHSSGANGVYGHSNSPTASGVYGENFTGAGYGVAGRVAGGQGVAVLADDADGSGVALQTTGKLQFLNRSGIATVAAGDTSKTVSVQGLTAKSMVMATVQQTGGFAVQAAVPAAGSFTIYLNKAPVSPATVKVAYLVLN
jgi:hypothetical protein